MKHFITIITLLVAMGGFLSSCSSTATYAEMVQEEKDAITNWIKNNNITVITSDKFANQGYVTYDNEYVLFNNTGVYMHIDNFGTDGEPLANGKSAMVLTRYTEINVNTGEALSWNNTQSLSDYVDIYNVRNYYGTYTATFTSGVMYSIYGSSVPGGWLVPLKYINLGRGSNTYQKDADGNYLLDENGNKIPGENAHVQIIAPHDQGTTEASSEVYATYYDLTYELADN